MLHIFLLIFICSILTKPYLIYADQGFYVYSDASYTSNEEKDLRDIPVAENIIKTSNIYEAGTTNSIYIMYIGTFSTSGPHLLGSFNTGTIITINIELQRGIGELVKIVLQNNHNDGWLFSAFKIQMNQIQYEFDIIQPYQWLQRYDSLNEKLYEDGYSPNAQVYYKSTSNMELYVKNKYFIYTSTGLLQDYTLN